MTNDPKNRKPGIGKRGNIDPNAKVFHVVQRTTMKLPLFESDKVFEYWQYHLQMCCIEENVAIICYIMMTNHIHAILYTEDYRRIGLAFKRLNTGLSQFVYSNVIKGTDFEKQFPNKKDYRLFSSAPRLFPIEGTIPLFIDTRYLFNNPKHHEAPSIGLYYKHSNFMTMYKSEYSRRDLRLFYDLYNMYPGQVVKTIQKPVKEFKESLDGIAQNLDRQKESLVFMVNPDSEWISPDDIIRNEYKLFDVQ